MTGNEIQTLLDKCISNGVLTLDATSNPLESPSIDALLGGVFSGALTATTGTAVVGDTSVVYPNASLHCQGFTFYDYDAQVAATLTISTGEENSLELRVQTTMPSGWTITDSFSSIGTLPYSPLQQIIASSAGIDVDSAISAVESTITIDLTTANSTLDSLQWLLGTSVQVSGKASFTIGPNDVAYPEFTLSGSAIASQEISGFTFDAVTNLRSSAAPALPDDSWLLMTSVDLTVDLITPQLTLPILIAIYDKTQTQFTVSLNPYADPPVIADLSQLNGFTWGQNVSLPENTPQGKLSLPSLSLVFDSVGRYLSSLQVTVSLGTDWTIVDNVALTGLQAQVYIPVVWGGTPPSGDSSSFSISVTAEFLIATASINVTINYPEETVVLSLAPATTIDIDAFLDALAPGVSLPGSGDLNIITLSAIADIPGSVYTFNASADGDLTIITGFTLTSIDIAVEWADNALANCQFGAGFTLAGAPLSMCVIYAGDNWSISGGSAISDPIDLTELAVDIASIFGVNLSSGLPQFMLAPLDMSYQTIDGSCSFDATVSGYVGNDPVLSKIQGSMNVAYDGTAKKWTGEITGTIILDANNSFSIRYDFKTDQVVSLSWTATGSNSIGIDDLCQIFGVDSMQKMIPKDLDLQLIAVSGIYNITTETVVFECKSKTWGQADVAVWNDKTTGWSVYFGVAIHSDNFTDISLTDIPLIGPALATTGNGVRLQEIQASIASCAITADQAAEISKNISAGYPTPPADGLPAGGALVMVFDANGQTTRISVGTTDAEGGSPLSEPSSGPKVPSAPGSDTVSKSTDGTNWFSIQKSFGPVTLQQVGVRYSDNKLWALLNASINSGGLVIETLGLGVGSPLTTFDPSYTVDGIDVSLTEGDVSFSGALVGTLDPLDLYGEFGLVFGNYSIGAIAGYADYQGDPSFFMYGVLNAPLGGPPFFFITGIAAGFGFNRSLVIPDVENVYQFPLVQWAIGNGAPTADPSGNIGQQVADTMKTLTASGVIAPNVGESWFAAGIHFTSFEMVDSFALAVFSAGNGFEVDLLGISTLTVPPAPSVPVAQAQLALKATIKPDSGLISIIGQLTPNSYVLSKSAKLTGGFAYCVWVAGEHAGECVMTMGGYSPNYKVPDYYPKVARLGLSWKVDECLSITGDLYFAVTSSAVMAGGSMSAVWQCSDIRAWFDVEADFIMVFTPFRYYISGSINLGASVRVKLLFTRITISVHVGVGFEIWGPDFSGKIKVDLSVISFTIGFGHGSKGGSTSVSWEDFVHQLLPSAPTSNSSRMASVSAQPAILQLVGLKGVLQTLSTEEGELNWLVDGQTFQAQVQTTIPLKTYDLQGETLALADNQTVSPNVEFGCGPVNVDNADFQSHITITVTATEDSTFDAEMVLGAAPKAFWEKRQFKNGVPVNVDPVASTTITNVLTGFNLVPFVAPPDQIPLPIPLQYLNYMIDPDLQSFAWSEPAVQTSNTFTASETVASTIAAEPARSNRPSLIAAINRAGLNVNQFADVSTLSSATSNYLLDQPVLCYLGEVTG